MLTETLSIPTNGIRLHAEAAGPKDGPLVIMLHGFPEFWGGFMKQLDPLANAGFRVVAPDQRGYNLSDKPAGTAAYQTQDLVNDITGLIDHLGREKAVIVGHDWGGVVAWQLALTRPEWVEKLVVLNAPHPAAHRLALRTPSTGQLLRSWYILFFQLPWLPEFLLRARGCAGLKHMLRSTARPETFLEDDLQRYVQAWRQPGALTTMINWYRAAVRGSAHDSARGSLRASGQADPLRARAHVSLPTLILWGEKDVALVPQLPRWSMDWLDNGKLVLFPAATHWVQHDEPERVSEEILAFLKP